MIVKVPAPSIQWSPTSPGTRKISHVITINPCGTLHFCTKLLTVEIWPIQPLRTLNICSKFHGNPSSCRQHTPLKFTPDEKSETEVSLKRESVTEVGRIHPLGTTNVCRWDIYSGFSLCVFSHGKEKVCESDVLVSFVVSFVFGVTSTGVCRGPIENRGGWLFLWFWCQMSEIGGILSSGSFTWCLCVILQSLSQDQP